jgi:hypothetical protein
VLTENHAVYTLVFHTPMYLNENYDINLRVRRLGEAVQVAPLSMKVVLHGLRLYRP